MSSPGSNNRLKDIRSAIARDYAERRRKAEQNSAEYLSALYTRYPELAAAEQAVKAAAADVLTAKIGGTGEEEAGRKLEQARERKARLLKTLQLTDDYDLPEYSCMNCQDTGYRGMKRCSCYQRHLDPYLRAYYHLDALKDYTFANFDSSVFNDVPKEAGTYSQRRYMERMKEYMLAWAQDLANVLGPQAQKDAALPDNLLLLGPTGTGKTYIAGSIANAVLEREIEVFYQSAPQALDLIRNYNKLRRTFSPDPEELAESSWLYERLMDVQLLIIDDLGTEAVDSAERLSEWLNLLNARQSDSKRTIISSNLNQSQLKQMYDERLVSRLLGNFSVIPFWGDDVRMRRYLKADGEQ